MMRTKETIYIEVGWQTCIYIHIYGYPALATISTTQIFATSDGSRIKWYLKPNSKYRKETKVDKQPNAILPVNFFDTWH